MLQTRASRHTNWCCCLLGWHMHVHRCRCVHKYPHDNRTRDRMSIAQLVTRLRTSGGACTWLSHSLLHTCPS